jgi:hypothetical protein
VAPVLRGWRSGLYRRSDDIDGDYEHPLIIAENGSAR